MKALEQFHVSHSLGIEVQIREFARSLILSGKLESGARLPATKELAQLWGVGHMTVQNALVPLVKEGLLIRRPKAGTFVRRREEKLTCVGIYYPEDTFGRSLFLQSLHAALKAEMNAQGIETDVWVDPRPHAQRGTPWSPFARAAEQREFQASIIPQTDQLLSPWLTKLSVPTAFFTTPDIPNAVGVDMLQFAELSLQALARQGCRSIGAILPLATTSAGRESGDPSRGFFERFGEVAQQLGLTTKNQWMRLLPDDAAPTGGSQESFGYEQFRELWGQSEKPDGLVVWPDTVARGAIMAMLEQQVRVPAELKLALHKNEAVDLLCPMPATFLVSSERQIAQALIQQVQKQFRGETCEPIILGFTVQPARSGADSKQEP